MANYYSAVRPLVSVQGAGDSTIALPDVFLSPIRSDIVRFVHTNMAKNSRQAYSVNRDAGHQTAAISWGTGRAVSRIPRVPGSGTHRAGQGAFGNMCRGGRMFAPTKTWRKWHRRINQNQKRYAMCSAIAASAVSVLVLARGHRVEQVPEIPLVIADESLAQVERTKQAIALLQSVGAYDDVLKSKKSKKIRRGKGKARNRRYVKRRGPLIVYSGSPKFPQAFRNLPGVELAEVSRLNLLTLAPGGHLGRFVLWTESAFKKLDSVYGTGAKASSKRNFALPRPTVHNADISRIINSDEIQSALNPTKKASRRSGLKKNPLNNLGVMVKLNPYAITQRRKRLLADLEASKKQADKKPAVSKKSKKGHRTTPFTKQLLSE